MDARAVASRWTTTLLGAVLQRETSIELLTGPDGASLLAAVLDAAGITLRDHRVRTVHHRGHGTVSVVWEADVTTQTGQDRSLLYVGHRSDRTVPDGAAQVRVGGDTVHVWQFPDDPYLPALRPAVHRGLAATHAAHLGLHDGPVHIHTRSYRPSRRAVVEVSDLEGTPVLYRKLLGGRTDDRRRERTAALVAAHEHLVGHLPIPRVLAADVPAGDVTLQRLGGSTLRSLLQGAGALPAAGGVAALVAAIGRTPTFPDAGDPVGYADVERHVRTISTVVPALHDRLARLAETVATVSGPVGLVHGDLHDGQLLVTDGAVTGLLDVDGAGPGPVALDLGRLVAHVEAVELIAPSTAERTRAWGTELVAALEELAPPAEIARAAAGAWVGLATGPIRDGRDIARRVTERVELAERWAARA